MHPPVAALVQLIGQQLRAPFLIVHVLNERVLDRHAPPRRQEVPARRTKELTDLPSRVDGNQLVAKIVVRRMERDRERHRHALPRQFLDRGNEADRRYGDISGAHTESLGRRINQTVKRGDNRLVVGEGLAHAHEDNVRELGRPARKLAIAARRLCLANLIDNLRRRQVTRQAHLSRRTEWTRHAAARLRRDAQCRSLGVAHENRLDLRAVVQAPQILDRTPAVSLQ